MTLQVRSDAPVDTVARTIVDSWFTREVRERKLDEATGEEMLADADTTMALATTARIRISEMVPIFEAACGMLHFPLLILMRTDGNGRYYFVVSPAP